ncbi:UDP-glucose 4-epimerase GalE [Candidatus Pelagibacter bacterium]|nr:UDP-glucose 4-epimerase GalE [Candidatus Pelagibacter bacterium]
MKNILITGGAGYIGSHVTNLLIDNNYNVSVIDNLITGNINLVNKKASFYKCDISDKKKIEKILNNNQFDIVMHFAGLIRVDESVKKPNKYNEFNYKKAKIFFDLCFKFGLKKVIFSSTAAVYGNPNVSKVSEKIKLNPLNPYAKTKLKLENYLIKKSISNNISYIILRYFNVAGADEKLRSGLISKYSTHLIKIAAEVATKKKDKIIINGDDYDTKDGTTVRDYIHVSDLANIHLISAKYLYKKNHSNIFNCGYGVGFSVKEVIDTFNQVLNKKINFRIGPRRRGDSQYLVASTSKFKKTFKWKPKFNNLKYILKTAYLWEKKLNLL